MSEVGLAKAALRRTMAAARDALAAEIRAGAANSLIKWAQRPEFRQLLPGPGGIIAGFLPIRSEIGIGALLHDLAEAGYRIALPRITGEGLVFHEYVIGATLAAGPFGTREPIAAAPILMPGLFLAPLLAFDAAGARLGYGKGYYDGAFARAPMAGRIGVAFSMQEVAAVPVEPHDARLDAILTEAGLIVTRAR